MRTETKTLIEACRILARDIQSDDGVANAALGEIADRLEEMEKGRERLRAALVEAQALSIAWAHYYAGLHGLMVGKAFPEHAAVLAMIESALAIDAAMKETK